MADNAQDYIVVRLTMCLVRQQWSPGWLERTSHMKEERRKICSPLFRNKGEQQPWCGCGNNGCRRRDRETERKTEKKKSVCNMFIQLACFSCVAWFFFLISYSVGRLVSECVWCGRRDCDTYRGEIYAQGVWIYFRYGLSRFQGFDRILNVNLWVPFSIYFSFLLVNVSMTCGNNLISRLYVWCDEHTVNY